VGAAQVRPEARQPGEQAEVRRHRRRAGLAGASPAATLAELGYNVKCFCYHDSPARAQHRRSGRHQRREELPERRRQHLPAVLRHVKGGDFRAREANVHRLAELSVNIIDQCVAQGVPFAREYGGTLARTAPSAARRYPARSTRAGQTGQQLLLGAYQALSRQIGRAGQACTRARDARSGPRRRRRPRHRRAEPDRRLGFLPRRRRRPRDRRLRNVFYLATNAKGQQRHGGLAGAPRGAASRTPALLRSTPRASRSRGVPVQAHPDERVAAERWPDLGTEAGWRPAGRRGHPRIERDYYLERKYPSFGNLAPRDISSRRRRRSATRAGVWDRGFGVYLDFRDAIKRLGRNVIEERYGNLFEMYHEHHGRRSVHQCQCASIRRRTTRWAGSGSTTT
jgi:succinate dehydrogenase / fumarate reductase, flavoprotein subunit